MADTDKLRSYSPRPVPQLPGSDARYLQQELAAISSALSAVRSVMQVLEARLAAIGG